MTVERRRGVLLVDGKERALKPVDPLGQGFIVAAAFDDERQRFVIIASDNTASHIGCGFVGMTGDVIECKLPRGFNRDVGYFYRGSKLMRFRDYDFKSKTERFQEVDLETGQMKELSDVLSIQSLIQGPRQTPIRDGNAECSANGAPLSPDGTMTVWQCGGTVECRGEDGKIGRIELSGASTSLFASPVSAAECDAFVDAAASLPWEASSFVWSHDSSRIYWCGHGREKGFVIDRECTVFIEGPCLRGASWERDDKRIIGVTNCGHETSEWEVPGPASHR